MKIVLFTNNFLPRTSGVSVAVSFLDRSLKGRGYQTFIIAPDYGFDAEVPGVDIHRVTSFSIQKLKFAVALQDLEQERILGIVEGFQPDIIHSHHPFLLGDTAARAADEFSVPLVYTFHTLYDSFAHLVKLDFPAVRRKVRDFVRGYADQSDLVIAPTEPIRHYLSKIGVSAPIATVPTGLDGDRFRRVTHQEVESLRSHFRLDRFETVLLYVGRITKEKRVTLCLATLDELIRRGRNCCLLIFGEGPERDVLTKAARQTGLQNRLILGGFLDQDALAAAYSLGDVFLFPSPSDTQGIVLYEARAAGLPIVASESMASSAILRPGENGLFAVPDAEDFADKVEQILDNPENFDRSFSLEHYSHEQLGAVYADLYGKLAIQGRLRRKPKPTRFKDLVEDLKTATKNGELRRAKNRRQKKPRSFTRAADRQPRAKSKS